eukprot:1937914-Amphidinium_carterae.1
MQKLSARQTHKTPRMTNNYQDQIKTDVWSLSNLFAKHMQFMQFPHFGMKDKRLVAHLLSDIEP